MGASLGLSAALFSAIAIGASVGSSLLAPKPKTPAVSPESVNRLRANIDPRAARKSAVGITALATDIRDEEFTDAQTYFHRFILCASHKVEEISEIWFDDKQAWSAISGIASEFSGYLTVAVREEGSAANAINISARMGSTRRYTGMAYVHLRYKLTGNSKKSDSPFSQSITTRITIRGKAAALYDPREDSTVAGGSGSQRADDQDTWVWDDDACRNPALALLFYLLGYKINGLLAVGKGIPPARIDLESFAIAASICDEEVDDGDGGTEPRYRCDGIWSEDDPPTSVMDMLKACMNADLDDVDGKLRLTVFHNDLATPVTDFTDADVLGAYVWEPAPSLDQTFNIVRGTFTDPSDTSLYQQIDYPEISIESPDGIDRILPVDFPMVQSPSQAQRLARLRLARQQYGGGTFKAEFQATAWKVQKNSVVRLTFAAQGFVTKLFRVSEMDLRVDGIVPLTLREEHASIYGAPDINAPLDPVASTPWDPALDPIVGAITDLDAGVRTLVSKSLNFPVSSGDDSISIAAFDGVLSDGAAISFPSDVITGLASGTTYAVLWDIAGETYLAVIYPAATELASSAYVMIGWQDTSTGGVFDPPEPPPPGHCVTDDTLILLADDTEVPASELVAGTVVRTQHEKTMEWGDWPVLAASFVSAPVFACSLEGANGPVVIRATAQHRFLIAGRWTCAEEIGEPDGTATVAKITVAEAHTYVSAGVLSHNIKSEFPT